METTDARQWQYVPTNSPQPLPKTNYIVHQNNLASITLGELPLDEISLAELVDFCSKGMVEGAQLSDYLRQNNQQPMAERKPILLLGELANPYQLARLKLGAIPVFTVRISDICRTYADSLDNRMINPGIHHITIARTQGWWEITHLAFATLPQIKQMIDWLSNNRKGDWRPIKLGEGSISLESNQHLSPPTRESLNWDGKTETVSEKAPELTGPNFDIGEVIVPIHTKYGCYDSRGKIIRCAHVGQRDFHTNLFRRGSSKKWQDIITSKN